MRRPLALATVVAAVSMMGACGGEPPPEPSPSVTPPVSSAASASPPPVTATASTPPPASPSLGPDVRLPAGAPLSYARDVAAAAVPIARLAPRAADVGSVWTSMPADRIDVVAFAWARGSDPFATQSGFEVWTRTRRAEPPWQVVYAFTDEPSSGVLGVRAEAFADVTGDGVPDALTFEDLGGSGACGVWRVVRMGRGDATEIYAKQTCDAQMRILGRELQIRASVYRPGDAHCCPSAYRTTTLRWSGEGWDVVDRSTTPA